MFFVTHILRQARGEWGRCEKSWPNSALVNIVEGTMLTSIIIIAAILFGIFSYRKALATIARVLWEMSFPSKVVVVIFFLGIMPLIFFDRLPGSLIPLAYAYTLGLLGYQLYRIRKVGRQAKSYLPRPTYWLVPCIVFVMFTPVCDLLLGRSYPTQTSVLVGATTLSYVCLYLIEIYIRYPHLER